MRKDPGPGHLQALMLLTRKRSVENPHFLQVNRDTSCMNMTGQPVILGDKRRKRGMNHLVGKATWILKVKVKLGHAPGITAQKTSTKHPPKGSNKNSDLELGVEAAPPLRGLPVRDHHLLLDREEETTRDGLETGVPVWGHGVTVAQVEAGTQETTLMGDITVGVAPVKIAGRDHGAEAGHVRGNMETNHTLYS